MDADFLPVAMQIVLADMAICDVLPYAILIAISIGIGLLALWVCTRD